VAQDLDARLLRFAGNAVDIYEQLNRRGGAAREVARQYLRAATSIGANYAEAAAGQTKPDFITRVAVARKECRESLFWLQLIAAKNLLSADVAKAELAEARQLAAILTAIVRKAKETSARG
jgi:four helix bundle protein